MKEKQITGEKTYTVWSHDPVFKKQNIKEKCLYIHRERCRSSNELLPISTGRGGFHLLYALLHRLDLNFDLFCNLKKMVTGEFRNYFQVGAWRSRILPYTVGKMTREQKQHLRTVLWGKTAWPRAESTQKTRDWTLATDGGMAEDVARGLGKGQMKKNFNVRLWLILYCCSSKKLLMVICPTLERSLRTFSKKGMEWTALKNRAREADRPGSKWGSPTLTRYSGLVKSLNPYILAFPC